MGNVDIHSFRNGGVDFVCAKEAVHVTMASHAAAVLVWVHTTCSICWPRSTIIIMGVYIIYSLSTELDQYILKSRFCPGTRFASCSDYSLWRSLEYEWFPLNRTI